MKHITLLFAFLCITFLLAAQENTGSIDLRKGPELDLFRDNNVPKIFGHDESGYYTYAFDYRPAVEHLDQQFQKTLRKQLKMSRDSRLRTMLGVCLFHDTIYMFTTEEHLKSKLLYVETIDKNTLEQNHDDRLLMHVPHLADWASDFDFVFSRQRDKLLVYSRLDALSEYIQDVHLMLFGEGLNLEWEAKQKIIYPYNPPRSSIIKVSDVGDVYFISLLDDQTVRSLGSGLKNRYHMITATENGQIVNSYALSLPDLYIRGVYIEPGENHTLMVSGFYSPSHIRGRIDGIFNFKLDNLTGEFQNTTMFDFNPEFLQEAISGYSSKNPGELFGFQMKELVRRNNGDFIMLAENQYDQDFDAYQNIIASCFSKEGMHKWTRVINKRQNVDPKYYFNHSSFYLHAPKYSDTIYLLFNEKDKNEFLSPDKRLKAFSPNEKANLKVVSISPDGEISNEMIYRKTSKRMKTPLPLESYDKLNNEMVMPIYRMKRYEYINITFN
ncbi:hypothetical protein ACFLQX_02260 [Bacteroidota bacterium]